MKKVQLLDDHRQAWAKLLGQRKVFRAQVVQFGHKHRQGSEIKKGATLLLIDVHQKYSQAIIDHVWVDYTTELAQFGEKIRPHAQIEFSAEVSTYLKGGKNAFQYEAKTYDDLQLVELQDVKIIKVPYWPKSYHSIVDDEVIRYAISTHTNIKTGFKLGKDPRGYLGSIYVGQNFCNRLARTLSWQWLNRLPKKYR